ncbi:MAG: TonB-dependent receptor [Succinivibrio sp.]|nr:TonB-dependent receptor [Succinivibrio sp.]
MQRALQYGTRFNALDNLHLLVGARSAKVTCTYDDVWTNTRGTFTENTERSNFRTVPYAGVTLDLTSELSAYFNYSAIFKPQSARDENHRLLDPITGHNYELGLKGSFLNNRLQASAAVYQISETNRPISVKC